MFKLDLDKHEVSDTPTNMPLPEGTGVYEIGSMAYRTNKNSGEGFVSFTFKRDGGSYSFIFNVESTHEMQQKIALDNIKKIADAVGIKGSLSAERFDQFNGRKVKLSVSYRPNPNNESKPYVNIVGVAPAAVAESKPETNPVAEAAEAATESNSKPWD